MTWPTLPPSTPLPSEHYDAGGDSPAAARAELLALKARVDQLSAALATIVSNGDPTLMPGRLLRVRRWGAPMAATEIGLLSATRSVVVDLLGAGGAGGWTLPGVVDNQNQALGSGGGAGGYLKAWVAEVPSNVTSVLLSVGAGGVSTIGAAAAGQESALKIYTLAGLQIELKALGGTGGAQQINAPGADIATYAFGGAGGDISISGPAIQVLGARGRSGAGAKNLGVRAGLAGEGADSPYGRGGYGGICNAPFTQYSPGGAATGYGAGGGGAATKQAGIGDIGGPSTGGFAAVWEFG